MRNDIMGELEYLRAEFEANKDKVYTKAEFDKLQKAFQEQAKIKDEYFLEIERLKGLIEQQEEEENNPYWYWPICDVNRCDGVSCRGGGVWEETGYWSVCPKHSQDFRDGKPQPKMKQSSIDREATRDEDGCLPNKSE